MCRAAHFHSFHIWARVVADACEEVYASLDGVAFDATTGGNVDFAEPQASAFDMDGTVSFIVLSWAYLKVAIASFKDDEVHLVSFETHS